jgi:hypothetical protein
MIEAGRIVGATIAVGFWAAVAGIGAYSIYQIVRDWRQARRTLAEAREKTSCPVCRVDGTNADFLSPEAADEMARTLTYIRRLPEE